ncbi:MAG: beta-ketoacyl synthase [Gammaproteobacteria bacterium]|nr:beta-ketoacyl synthase [Gammaproteobacteria bacterium]
MARLPVIIGFGGVNPAGRISSHHAYRRTVIDAIGKEAADDTYASLAALMNLDADSADPGVRTHIKDHTLIRRVECFDPDDIPWQRRARLQPADGNALAFTVPARDMPERIPDSWDVIKRDDGAFDVTAPQADVLVPDRRDSRVTSAGEAPTGFDPGSLYQSRSHPRGLQLAIYGASDAVRSVGIPWQELKRRVRPDQFSAYAGSAMGQLDDQSTRGMMQAPMMGRRPNSKQAALGLVEMPADFVNAYVIGSVGATGGMIGACATFLYNLRSAVDDIKSGRCRVALAGSAEAPIVPELMEAFRTMGALAEDEALMAIDGTDQVDNRRACRPFAENCGFTMAEASVYVVLVDDELALELGADIHGAVPDVFVNADGFKKSIPGPGVGNYITVGKALATARAILGEEAVRQRSYIHAHGTGTPQNRVTESHILNEMAKAFGIERWDVAAIKAYLGHTLAPASGDQVAAALGAWQYGWIPGIATIEGPADDVHHSNLRIGPEHIEIDPEAMDVALVNSKGFGGNNATGVVLSPHVTQTMLAKRHGANALQRHARRNEGVRAAALDYDAAATRGEAKPIYHFGEDVLQGDDIGIDAENLRVPGYSTPVSLDADNPFPDMT